MEGRREFPAVAIFSGSAIVSIGVDTPDQVVELRGSEHSWLREGEKEGGEEGERRKGECRRQETGENRDEVKVLRLVVVLFSY